MGERLFQNAAKTQTFMTAQQVKSGYLFTTAVLKKILACDHMRITKRNGGSFDNNAGGRYDWIAPPMH